MTNKLETYTTLVACTSHMTETDLLNLEAEGMVGIRDSGVFVKLYEDAESIEEMCYDRSLSDSLKQLLLFGLANNCRMVELDCDGPVIEGIFTHVW